MRNHSYENDFHLHENETACRTHFHKKGFALRLVLKKRDKGTRKWPINVKLRISISVIKIPLSFSSIGTKEADDLNE